MSPTLQQRSTSQPGSEANPYASGWLLWGLPARLGLAAKPERSGASGNDGR